MIGRRGWEAILASLAVLLFGLFSLNPILELLGVAAFGFLVTEMLAFEGQLRSFGPEWFTATRSAGPRRMPCDGELATSVELVLGDHPSFRAEIYEVLPESFDIVSGSPRTTTWVTPHTPVRLAYTLRPRVRGAYVQGPTVVIARDAFGLCYRTIQVRTDRPFTIVPASIAGRLGRLGVALFTRVQASLSIRRRGFGTEFRSLRPYQLSDDIRHVAWKRSTLSNLIVREFEQDSRQEFVLVLDLSGAMSAGLWGRNALDVSVEAAALMTNLIARQGEDHVGLLGYAGGVFQYVRPGRGPLHFRKLVDNLALATHRPGDCPLPELLGQLTRRLGPRSHLFLFTAAEGSLDGLPVAYANLRAHGHRPYLFLPNRSAFYPEPPGAATTRAMAWARGGELARFHAKMAAIRSEGIPVFPFDRRGAGDRVLFAYTQIRAWGAAR